MLASWDPLQEGCAVFANSFLKDFSEKVTERTWCDFKDVKKKIIDFYLPA